eukprot:Tamp_10923.p2 GENE.Tamp_10923~~Tamp_10923.p2  ORF type:complete len:234 (+),score=47.74 Tamp_10923:1022-1723(+)
MAYGARGRRPDQQPVPAACAGSLLLQCSSLLFQCSSLLLQCSSLLFLMPVLAWCVLRDDRAKTPHDVPDGFYPIRRCQFLQNAESGCFEIITSGGRARMQVLKHKTAEGQLDLQEWAHCYKRAMNDLFFPYFYVHQNCRMDLTRELLLGVCKGGLRLVKLGLYDPGREEEIAFFSYSEIYEWGCCDIQTFEFCAASERAGYEFKTLHASDIEAMVLVKFARWKESRNAQRPSR